MPTAQCTIMRDFIIIFFIEYSTGNAEKLTSYLKDLLNEVAKFAKVPLPELLEHLAKCVGGLDNIIGGN